MEKKETIELVDLSKYTLQLHNIFQAESLSGSLRGLEKIILDVFYQFQEEYKVITADNYEQGYLSFEKSHDLSQKYPKHKVEEKLSNLHISFKEKNERLIKLCNLKFEWLLSCGVFAEKK